MSVASLASRVFVFLLAVRSVFKSPQLGVETTTEVEGGKKGKDPEWG